MTKRYADTAVRDAAIESVGPDGTRRVVVPYDDFDGISLVADHVSLLARYADHDLRLAEDTASVAARPSETLCMLASAGEAVSWGTHQPPGECLLVLSLSPFGAEELAANGIRSTLDAGCLVVRGPLSVAAWHSFTYGCDYQHGDIRCARVELPLGTYRVTVHRPFGADEVDGTGPGDESGARTAFLVALARVEADVRMEMSAVPGADGWL